VEKKMSRADAAEKGRKKSKSKSAVSLDILSLVDQAIANVDEAAAAGRVTALRKANPEASAAELAELLVKQKCMQTGAVGAVTSGAALVPGLGTLVSLTFGVAADIGVTFKLQAELVVEIASVYERKLTPAEKRNVVMLVTGLSAGASQALRKAGQRIAEEAGERLAQKSITKAIPVLGVAASAGTNILFTYAIGRRAQAYFSLGPEAVGDWGESLRALTGVDERMVTGWLTETTERSWRLVSQSAQSAAGAVIVAGKSAGEVVVVGAGKAGEAIAGVGQGIASGASTAAGTVVDAGKKAGEAVAGAGKSVAQGASAAAGAVADAGKKAGAGLAAGVGRAGEAVAGAGRRAGKGASQAVKGLKKRDKSEKEE
jgi:uncharacterized protein (DUF697 family)